MWRVAAEVNSPKVLITGPEGRYVFQVFSGRITREILTALKAIQHPVLRRRIRDGFEVKCPVQHRAFDNKGDRRKFLLLRPPGKATTELRLVGPQHITKALLHAIKDVIERREDPGVTMDEIRAKAVESGRRGGLMNAKPQDERRSA